MKLFLDVNLRQNLDLMTRSRYKRVMTVNVITLWEMCRYTSTVLAVLNSLEAIFKIEFVTPLLILPFEKYLQFREIKRILD